MAAMGEQNPLLLSGRAAQRLAAIYRQHKPEHPGLAVPHQAPTSFSRQAQPSALCTTILDVPCQTLPHTCTSSRHGSESQWHKARDIHTEVCLTCATLCKLSMLHGSLAQVANANDQGAAAHVVRLIAVDAPRHADQAHANSDSALYSDSRSLVPAQAQQSLDTHASMVANAWQDETAYIPPSLAFNLGLQYQLWPLMAQPQLQMHSNKTNVPSGNTVAEQQFPHQIGQGYITISPLQEVPPHLRTIQLPQSGRDAAQVPLASSMRIASISIPRVALLEAPASKGKEKDSAGGLPSTDTVDHVVDRSDRTAEAGTSGQGSDEARQAEEDKLVAELQRYFQRSTRLLAQGDVFAMPNDPGETAALLRSLYPSQATQPFHPELQYFKVISLQPSCGTSCAIDFMKTQVMLEGNCSSAFPVGLPAYIAADTQSTTSSSHTQHTAALDHHSPSYQSPTTHISQESNSSLQPLAATQAEKGGLHPGSSTKRQIGVHANAAWEVAPEMLGYGPLLPLWRQLTDLLVPLLHQGSSSMALQVAALLLGPRGSGRATAARAATAALGIHLVPFSCHDLKGQTEAHTATALKATMDAAQQFAPAVLLLQHFEVLAETAAGSTQVERTAAASRLANALTHCITKGSNCNRGKTAESRTEPQASSTPLPDAGLGCVVIVACAESADDLPAGLRRCFTHELPIEAPDAAARKQLIQGLLGRPVCQQLGEEAIDSAVSQTAGLLPRDLHALVADAAAAAAARKLDIAQMLPGVHAVEPSSKPSVIMAGNARPAGSSRDASDSALVTYTANNTAQGPQQGLHVSGADVQASLDGVRQRTATVIGAPKVPDVRWDDVGGLENVKRAILDTVELPLKHPTLFAAGLRQRSGVLLYGPPGTGKTLVAKAVATECSINFLSVKGPELINMYIGESERQVREIFARARRARPCVLFFDELDSLAPARGAGADSGGVMDRVVSQLLAEVDGVQAGALGGDLFVIGATNRPDLIDPALLRPGRLDVLLYVGVAEDSQSKLKVLQALTRKFKLEADIDLPIIAEKCPPTFTGADMYALSSDAWMTALKRTVAQAHDAQDVTVIQEDFWEALSSLKPSLSAAELTRYQKLKDHYESRGR